MASTLAKLAIQDVPHQVTRLYFEAHITVDPKPTEEMYRNKNLRDYSVFVTAAGHLGWKCSKFEHDDVDQIAGMWFMSYKTWDFQEMREAVTTAVETLEAAGWTVARAKIENAVWDTKYGDTYNG